MDLGFDIGTSAVKAVLIDRDGRVLRPCILWNDGRSHDECRELEDSVPDFRQRSGNMAMPDFTAPKLLWVRKHEPEVFGRIAKVLLPKDYLQYRLTGQFASKMSDAAGTLWLDPARRADPPSPSGARNTATGRTGEMTREREEGRHVHRSRPRTGQHRNDVRRRSAGGDSSQADQTSDFTGGFFTVPSENWL